MNQWRSISLPINSQMAVYKNLEEKRPRIETTRDFARHGMHESTLHLPLHTGTHVDYPLHAIAGGKNSSDYDRFPLVFSAYVHDLAHHPPESITLQVVCELPLEDVEAVFFRTRQTPLIVFDPNFPWLTDEAAGWLARRPLLFVGIDQPGIERNQPGHPTHNQLLAKDILIIEGLNLSAVQEGVHRCAALTLGIEQVEAEPVAVYVLPF